MPGEEREVPIRGDTELRDRDFWGDLSDYYPRAVQDEIQMMSGHKWWWTVDALNVETGSIDLSRKDKVVRESFRVGPLVPTLCALIVTHKFREGVVEPGGFPAISRGSSAAIPPVIAYTQSTPVGVPAGCCDP